MILGVNPVQRIVYVGSSRLFSSVAYNDKAAARISIGDLENMNYYGKLMANLWAWMIMRVVYQ